MLSAKNPNVLIIETADNIEELRGRILDDEEEYIAKIIILESANTESVRDHLNKEFPNALFEYYNKGLSWRYQIRN